MIWAMVFCAYCGLLIGGAIFLAIVGQMIRETFRKDGG